MKKLLFVFILLSIGISLFSQDNLDFIDYQITKINNFEHYDWDISLFFGNIETSTLDGIKNDEYAILEMKELSSEMDLKAYFSKDKMIALCQILDGVSIRIYISNGEIIAAKRFYDDGTSSENTIKKDDDLSEINNFIKIFQTTYDYYFTQKYSPELLK